MHPDLLPHVTPIVLTALTSPEIALYATMALKDMSRDCAGGMKPYSEVRNRQAVIRRALWQRTRPSSRMVGAMLRNMAEIGE